MNMGGNVDRGYEAFVTATKEPSLCPECGQMSYGVARDGLSRWDEDKVRERLGFPVEGRCGNCGSPLSGRTTKSGEVGSSLEVPL